MAATTTGRIAGLTGTGTLGFSAAFLARLAWGHDVPTGMWAVLAATIAVAGLGLVLDYRREQTRLAVYKVLLEKSAGEPASAASYRTLILADALHLAVEQNRDVTNAVTADTTRYKPMPGCSRLDPASRARSRR
jgi:hypothetical protein